MNVRGSKYTSVSQKLRFSTVGGDKGLLRVGERVLWTLPKKLKDTYITPNEGVSSWTATCCMSLVQGYLAHKKTPISLEPPRTLGIGLR